MARATREKLSVNVGLRAGARRSMYITEAIIERHGKSKKCDARKGEGSKHTEACRERMEKLEAEYQAKQNPTPVTA